MRVHRLQREQRVNASLEEVFDFFARARNLEELTPPWLRFSVGTPEPIDMRAGALIDYRLRLRGIPLRWRSRIDLWEPGQAFIDRQLKGPYRLWHHRHEFKPEGDGTRVRDIVDYALPFGLVGELAHRVLVRRDLQRIFDYRQRAVADRFGDADAR